MKLYLPFRRDVKLTSPFGVRTLNGTTDYHKGIDLVGIDDIIVCAPCDAVVGQSTIVPQWSGNLTWQWGNYVRLDTSDGLYIFLCHLDSRYVTAGQAVKRGQPIGIMGNTGYSFGAHTHVEIRDASGKSLNPCSFFEIPNKTGIYKNEEKEIDDMTKEDVKKIFAECIAEYEAEQKKKPVPYSEDELAEAVKLGITDGTRPCEPTPRFQTAIMVKRAYTKLNAKIEKLSAKLGDKAYEE